MNSSNFARSASVNGRGFLFLRAMSMSMYVVILKGLVWRMNRFAIVC